MSKHLNPSYGKKMNDDKTSFTLVAHVPGLPAAAAVYKDKVLFNKKDACFYRCRLREGAPTYIWEQVTFGIKRQFVLPVSWIVTRDGEWDFNDEVAALRNIILEMSKYVTLFQEMLDSDDPDFIWVNPDHGVKATENQYTVVCNAVIDWVNEYCQNERTQLDKIPYGTTKAKDFAIYINALIGALNPHAGFSVEMDKVHQLKGVFEAIADVDTTGISDPAAKYAINAIKTAAAKGAEILKNPFEEENNG